MLMKSHTNSKEIILVIYYSCFFFNIFVIERIFCKFLHGHMELRNMRTVPMTGKAIAIRAASNTRAIGTA